MSFLFGSAPKPPPPPPPPPPPNQLGAKQLGFAALRATPVKNAGFRSLIKTTGMGLANNTLRTGISQITGR